MDEIDLYIDKAEKEHERRIAFIRASAAKIPIGESGICSRCGEESKRLVSWICAPCRDEREKQKFK